MRGLARDLVRELVRGQVRDLVKNLVRGLVRDQARGQVRDLVRELVNDPFQRWLGILVCFHIYSLYFPCSSLCHRAEGAGAGAWPALANTTFQPPLPTGSRSGLATGHSSPVTAGR